MLTVVRAAVDNRQFGSCPPPVARLPVGAPFPGSDPAPARDPASRVVPRGDAVEVNRIDT